MGFVPWANILHRGSSVVKEFSNPAYNGKSDPRHRQANHGHKAGTRDDQSSLKWRDPGQLSHQETNMAFDAHRPSTSRRDSIVVEIPRCEGEAGRNVDLSLIHVSQPHPGQQWKPNTRGEQWRSREHNSAQTHLDRQKHPLSNNRNPGRNSVLERHFWAEISKLKREVEGVKQRSDQLKREHKDDINALEAENNSLREQLYRKGKEFVALDSAFEECEERHRREIHSKNNNILRLRQALCTREHKIEELESAKSGLTRNLESCKDRIFSMQPAQGMTDTQLQAMYKNICSSIDCWVDQHFGDVENTAVALAPASLNSEREHFLDTYLDREEHFLVLQNPQSEGAYFMAVFFRHLQHRILSSDKVFPGLDDNTSCWLKAITQNVEHLHPAKDFDSIQVWRIDMHRALSSLEPAGAICTAELERVTVGIMAFFGTLRGMQYEGEVEQKECRQILEDVAELAMGIRQSTAMYDFETEVSSENKVVKVEDLKRYNIIDSRTGSALRTSIAPKAGLDGRVGEVLFVVYPAFVRKATKSAEKIKLVKSTIVVKFDHEIPRGGRVKAAR